jgi:hypothetical protein
MLVELGVQPEDPGRAAEIVLPSGVEMLVELWSLFRNIGFDADR